VVSHHLTQLEKISLEFKTPCTQIYYLARISGILEKPTREYLDGIASYITSATKSKISDTADTYCNVRTHGKIECMRAMTDPW